jgi:esterase/lipase
MRKIAAGSLLAVVGLVVLFYAGPRTPIDLQLRAHALPEDLDQYLAQSEARYPDIVPGAEKTIVWAGAPNVRTGLSIVYVHGFSATRQETAPLSDGLAAQLGANLFYSRLTGHGQTGAALAEATVNDWLNDGREALEIGRRIGERVIVIGTSTGGTLAAWLAQQPNTEAVRCYVLISPNFAPRDSNAEILTGPWAAQFAQLLVGPEYSWTPLNAQQDRYWTHQYPSNALVTMMGLVHYVRESDLESIRAPVLVIYSPNDLIVSPQEVERRFAQIGSDIKALHPIDQSGNPENHVLAGDILAADNTQRVADLILDFVAGLP